ncbi:ubiquitin carboxyl-terminal hydrolase 17-like [Olea europaea subsp. europaea]|uniref:Ubiquitin carboxyl-terminal hydrolase 17-like n=1 Tax=Olea europaea subsp. europaea TaxID=158383 RepID=A0A8S0Q5X9_OLEEU|nr:ubiquitin carboxyl-terminal hydrolase 17-like [Olea europaea subsp. europaea]
MLIIVGILLTFCLVVRQKWKNATAKREEILRLVTAAPEEQAEFAEIIAVEEHKSSPLPPPSRLEKRYYCAVCLCPTTTRCSQCKAVRYCSGKCQIIHWRQGHKDECRPATKLDASEGSECSMLSASHSQFKMQVSKFNGGSDSPQSLNGSGSLSTSLPRFSSSATHRETSSDASICEVPGSETPLRSDKLPSEDANTDMRRTTRDSANMEFARPSSLDSIDCSVNKILIYFESFNAESYTGLGKNCYANAVLQCLAFTRPISSYLLHGVHSKTCKCLFIVSTCSLLCLDLVGPIFILSRVAMISGKKQDWCFICEFEFLLLKGQKMESPLSPIGVLSQIQKIGSNLSHGREEDAHEFLRCVVETMQSICLEEAGIAGQLDEESTLVALTFGGYLRSKIKCMKCSGRSERCDRMMDLTVEIGGHIDTLEEALVQFTTSETLTGDNKYKCCRCKSYQKAKKKLTVLEAPNILTIVLKRFRSGNLGKLDKLVQFPEVLNLAPFMSGTNDKCPIYSLYGLVVHLDIMNAAYSGHYISYVKDFQGDWFRVDDSRVIPVDLETVLSEQAYILLYARHNPRGPSLARDSSSSRNLETNSLSSSGKRRNLKTKLPMEQSTDTTMHYQRSRRYPILITPTDHILDTEGLRQRNPFVDSSSDSSSILSVSDAGSYSTDSTKDSSAEDASGYMFRPSWYVS